MIRKFDETEQYDTSMKIIFATNNAHKLSEVQAVLGPDFELVTPRSVGITEEIPEQQDTIAGNASQKARYVHDRTGCDCFADDTGLEVPELGGEPGVHSARYAEGTDHNSEANMQKLLARLGDSNDRRAQFRTVIALARRSDVADYTLFEGIVRGTISREKQGTEGFGYDPIFVPEGYEESFAQLGMDIKNGISHRARAVAKLAEYLK